VSEDQGILRQIGALRTEMLHFFLILLLSDGFYNEHTGFSLEAGTRDFQEV
jgi:hypothetical protein